VRETAAICVVIHESSVLLLRRKKREGDPWSGDMSFPGGFSKEGETPVETAAREFSEETGVDSIHIKFERQMDFFQTPRFSPLKVFPVIYSSEVEFQVIPGDEMEYGGWYNLQNAVRFLDSVKGPCLRFGDDIVWGLTYRILERIGILPGSE
jgi:ADP-ribose pyrophosphatase YjhB (NUDIX family)